MSSNPNLTAAKPATTVIKIYKPAVRYSPELINFIFSKAKVEKVVKPPQKPVINISLKLSFAKFA